MGEQEPGQVVDLHGRVVAVHRRARPPAEPARVAGEYIDAIDAGADPRRQPADLIEDREVRPVRTGRPAGHCGHPIGCPAQPLRMAPDKDQVVTAPGEGQRRGQPDAGTGPVTTTVRRCATPHIRRRDRPGLLWPARRERS
jgi:hypothetical protein